MPEGQLRTHLLLQSERLDTWTKFKVELATVRETMKGLGAPVVLDVDGVGSKGLGKGQFQGNCRECGKGGH